MPKSLEDLENEMRILKSEVQQALLDIREFLLTYVDNPFAPAMARGQSPSAGTLSSLSQGANGFSAGEQPTVVPTSGGTPSSPSPGPGGEANASSAPGSSPPPGAPVAQTGSISISMGGQSAAGEPAPSRSPNDKGTPPQDTDRSHPSHPVQRSRGEGPASLRQEEHSSAVGDGDGLEEEPHHLPERTPDLVTLALLAPWVEEGLRQVGRATLEKVVSLYDDLGGVAPGIKKTVAHLLALTGDDRADTSSTKPSLRQCLRLLADLDALLHRARRDRAGAALLAAYLSNRADNTTG